MIHTLQNYYGKRSGFVVELRDETEHYQALELFEHYNQKLTEEVDAKTQQIASIQEKIIKEWVDKKIKDTYVKIEDGWDECDFEHAGWKK